jgi:hypothetical protein
MCKKLPPPATILNPDVAPIMSVLGPLAFVRLLDGHADAFSPWAWPSLENQPGKN